MQEASSRILDPQKCKNMVKNANTYMRQFANVAAEEALEVEVIHRYFDILKTVNNDEKSVDNENDEKSVDNEKWNIYLIILLG